MLEREDIPEYVMKTVTNIPMTNSHFGWRYDPTISVRWEATRIITMVIGRTRPFKAPVRIRILEGLPQNRKIRPDAKIKVILRRLRLRSIFSEIVARKVMEV